MTANVQLEKELVVVIGGKPPVVENIHKRQTHLLVREDVT
jgi:hypothetical protein